MGRLSRPLVHEEGDRLYVVTPLAPMSPSRQDIEEFAFGKSIVEDLQKVAPNEHIAWYGGHYVEAEQANLNGAMWLSDELAVKSLTPLFMPVTVMHDPRSAVGVIADTRLRVPPQVPRNKIETALAVWRHRFPEIVEEAEANYAQGTLMQSMECMAPDYSCSECGATYHKLPQGAEQEGWCDHLKASSPSGGYGDLAATRESATAVRILRNVVFTGTGLIFGTQGGTGADPEAHLESFFGEVAEFHERAHTATTTRPQRSTPSMETVAKSEFDRVVAERDAAVRERDEAREQSNAARTEVEAAEQKAKDAEEAKAAAEKKVNDFEEKARKQTLADERMEALGKGFVAKLGDKTKTHLREDAAALSDEAWNRRLEGVEELAGVKRDDKGGNGDGDEGDGGEGSGSGSGSGDGETFSREEVASAGLGGASHSNGVKGQTPESRRSIIGGLAKPRKPETAKS